MRTWLMGSIVCLAAVPALGQSTRPTTLPADQMLSDMLKPQNSGQGSATTLSASDVIVLNSKNGGVAPNTRVIREGTEILDRAGRMVKSSDGPWEEFVFENKGSDDPLPNMRVLPDLKLMAMENAEVASNRQLRFIVSGTVTEYKGKNYVLLGSNSGGQDRQQPPPPPVPRATAGKPVSADQMLNQMLPSPGKEINSAPQNVGGPMADKTSGPGAVAPGAPVLTVMREQSQIIDRVGRLTRSPDGQQAQFTFDSDGAAMEDPPLLILPSLKLATMENTVVQTSKDVKFRITGIITEYRGRNGVLLQKVVVVPDSTDQF